MNPLHREEGLACSAPPTVLANPLFVFCAPRSFTSVVAAMLGRHPQMYGLPETHFFTYDTMAEWWKVASVAVWPMNHGLLRAVAELYFGGQTEATVRRASGWLRRRLHLTTGAMMETLIERVHPRIAVDKSPGMAWRVDAMSRARAMFPQARFVHLLRHPRAHGESVLKYVAERAKHGPIPPTHWLIRLSRCPPPAPFDEDPESALPEEGLDPQWGWYTLNRNIADFLATLPPEQVYRVRGEDLLTSPDSALPPLVAWLGLRDDPEAIEEMKHPERSPYACFGPRGAKYGMDAYFLESPALRPTRAKPMSLEGLLRWRADGHGFAPEVRRLAREFGYS